ncbi:MAG: DUF937 domain-containing protein, partial [Methylococcales bacterium]|nr:DUF937 domain-containing protein [Methylococcales bacterium]
VMGQLGGVLGGAADQNSSAISSAIPGLLSSLTSSGGAGSSGAEALLGAVNNQDDSILDNLSGLLGGSGQSSLMSAGSGILGSLLGGGGVGSLVSAIAGFSGLGKGPAKSLLGLLAPIIFSVVKRKLMGGGGAMDVGSLMGMLNGQKDNIAAAMPSGFNLDAAGSADDVTPVTRPASSATASNTAPEGKSFLGKLLPIALVIGGLLFAYNFFTKGGTDKAVDVAKDAVPGNMDLGQELTGVMGSVTDSLGGITDVTSAEAAIPQLDETTSKLGGLVGMMDKLPEAARAPISGIISNGLPQIQGLIDKISAIPGVGPIIKPAVDGLMEKLALFQ